MPHFAIHDENIVDVDLDVGVDGDGDGDVNRFR
jgi:hypothetical protein